jgi:hypothetical protein
VDLGAVMGLVIEEMQQQNVERVLQGKPALLT